MPRRRTTPAEDLTRAVVGMLVLAAVFVYGAWRALPAYWRTFWALAVPFALVIIAGVIVAMLAVWIPHLRHKRELKQLELNRRMQLNADTNLFYRKLVDLSPPEFEKAMCRLFELHGFTVVHSGRTGDGGVDMRMEREGLRYIGQCKRYTDKAVPADEVRDFYGTMTHEGVDRGYFITTSRFTTPALEFSQYKAITMVDGEKLRTTLRQMKADGQTPLLR